MVRTRVPRGAGLVRYASVPTRAGHVLRLHKPHWIPGGRSVRAFLRRLCTRGDRPCIAPEGHPVPDRTG